MKEISKKNFRFFILVATCFAIIFGANFFAYSQKLNAYGEQFNLTISVQSENEDYEFFDSLAGGTVKINNEAITTNDVQKNVTVGDSITLSAKASQNYIFVGWFLKNDDTYSAYKFDEYVYDEYGNVTFTIERIDASTTNLVARFAYNASIFSLDKIFIDENNSNQSYSIIADGQIVNAKLITSNNEFEGIEYISFEGSKILIRSNEEIRLQIMPDINYQIFISNPVTIENKLNNSDSLSIEYELDENQYFISIKNNGIVQETKIKLNMQKNYNLATLIYGTNSQMNNFDGADVHFETEIEESDNTLYPVFNVKTNTSSYSLDEENQIISKTCNVYISTNIYVTLNIFDGYRLDFNNSEIKYKSLGEVEDILFEYIYYQGSPIGIKIFNIIDDIDISLKFYKIYNVTVGVNSVNVNNEPTKIGQIKVESDDFTYDNVQKFVKEETAIYCETTQTQLEEGYDFKNWVIKTSNGEIADYEILQISQTDLLENSINIKNIYTDLTVEAVYGKRIFNIDVICSDINGTLEVVGKTGQGYFWQVEYNDNIKFKFTPKSEMYIFELLSCTDQNYKKTKSGNSTYIELKNISSNHTINIQFAPDTVYRHLKIQQLEGDGTRDMPYLIKTANDLCLVSYYVNNNSSVQDGKIEYKNAYFKLEKDIELSDQYYFVPIGNKQNNFNGIFDYNYHSVENIIIENMENEQEENALFGVIGQDAKILRQHKSILPIVIGAGIIVAVIALAFVLVYRIEKKRQRPKKVFVINIPEDK